MSLTSGSVLLRGAASLDSLSELTIEAADLNVDALSDIPDDEWDVDFSDNREFLVKRWSAIQEQCRRHVSPADWKTIQAYTTISKLGKFLSAVERKASDVVRQSLISEVKDALSSYKQITEHLVDSMEPQHLDQAIVWGSIQLLIHFSLNKAVRMARIVEVITKARRVIERTLRCVRSYKEEQKEIRRAMVDILGAFALLQTDIVQYIYANPNENMDPALWPALDQTKIQVALQNMEGNVKHLHELAATTQLTNERQTSYVQRRNAGALQMDPPDIFPCEILPFRRNNKFYGREDVLAEMEAYLHPKTSKSLRTFTIYGRRGVGKTNIALEYAHRNLEYESSNPSKFDAVFWIQCETAVSLRLSFTQMALKLRLGGASQTGHHEENLLLCHSWLKITDKNWLLIFDNAEDDDLLSRYWPASKGAIIITSRSFHNFNNHAKREGATIHPFTDQESWELLVRLLGWRQKLDQGEISDEAIRAAKTLIQKMNGLPLAIDQTASLLQSERFTTIQELVDTYDDVASRLEPRPTYTRSGTNFAIDVLWSIVFATLSKNAQAFLSVLCLLSPDATPLNTFLPRNQDALTEFLAFCKQETWRMANLTPQFREVLDELIAASLVKREGQILIVHRVVQEAFLYVSWEKRQDAFRAGACLMFEAFPRQINGRSLHPEWERCERYIQGGLFLAYRFKEFVKVGYGVNAPDEFRKYLMSCAWYLFEIGDHFECLKLLEEAYKVCKDKSSLDYAHLRNTAGSTFFELNDLRRGREAYREALEIRTRLLDHNHEELANTINNLGNLESAKGNYARALVLFERAEKIRLELGDEVVVPLAATYLGIGRVLLAKQEFRDARKQFEKAESLILRSAGTSSPIMGSLQFAYGNLERAQGEFGAALRYYEQALEILYKETPTHVLVSCTHYKIGCVESSLGNITRARRNLETAFNLADLSRSGVDDGNIARILWRQAQIGETQPWKLGRDMGEASILKDKAEQMRMEVEKNVGILSEEKEPDEITYDRLVCGYFR